MKSRWPAMNQVLACLGLMAITASIEYWMGRLPFCKCGIISLWSGNIWSNQNSQQLADPYTFTHILHGMCFYLVLWLAAGRKLAPGWRLVLAVLLESGWEILENSNMVIDRYRTVTLSLDYYGDSILNSMGDILAMALGFILAWRLPARVTVTAAVAMELVLLWWIRDNLALNLVMLIHPVEAIRQWQMVH